MKLMRLHKKQPPEVGQPMPLPQVEVTAPQTSAPLPPKKIKRKAIAVPPEAAAALRRSIDTHQWPPENVRATPRIPRTPSTISLTSNLSLRDRRSSSRSLELLRAAEENGQLPIWDNLPPSPNVNHIDGIRKYTQWGDEAGSEAEKLQRSALVPLFVQTLEKKITELTIAHGDLVTDLPEAITDLRFLKVLRLHNLTSCRRMPDLRCLPHLELLEVSSSPGIRVPTLPNTVLVIDGEVISDGLPLVDAAPALEVGPSYAALAMPAAPEKNKRPGPGRTKRALAKIFQPRR